VVCRSTRAGGDGKKLLAWLEGTTLPIKSREPDVAFQAAISAWHMMGQQIEWAALDVVAELLDVRDAEGFIAQLFVIRGFAQRLQDAQHR